MKIKVLFLLILVFTLSLSVQAQRGVRIGYIDTEYILENVPDYQEALSQLDSKAQKWKNEIEAKLNAVEQKRKDLSNEKALLTKELIDEREEDITFEEKEIFEYQQKRFGPSGDLMIQKKQLMQPIQDQIFAAVQDIAAGRKYDVIFDKSDVVMLYSAEQFDLSERILRTITRASNRKQVQSKADKKAIEGEEVVPIVNIEQESRQKAIDEKKATRESAIEKARQEKLAIREAKAKEAEAKRQKNIEAREKAKQAKLDARNNTVKTSDSTATKKTGETKTRAQLIEENRQKKIKQREARKKALDAKKKKILEERQKAKDSTNKKN